MSDPADKCRTTVSFFASDASFEERVVDLLSAHRGHGLMLSALDSELLATWARMCVPFEVVARGIAKAAQAAQWDARPGEPAVRTLRACRRHVEVEIQGHLARVLGASTVQGEERR
jgi:hypothetical protein